jgi:pimeloyl-ACP methyl ester carboxylesterase
MLDDRDILSYLPHEGERIAFDGLPGDGPGLFFLGGFASDMTGAKASYVAALARTQGLHFTRFDYSGHGKSSGDFAKGTIGRWLSDAMAVFDQVTRGPQILIGSSMGGWLAFLLALRRPERVAGIIGIATGADFTQTLVEARMTPEQAQALERDGQLETPHYVITKTLIESGRAHSILSGPLRIDCPVRLLHGMRDEQVPWQASLQLAEVLTTDDVTITLIKDGEHRLSREDDLSMLKCAIEELRHPARSCS